jgi:DNA-binding PadR family transcriptional regulator
MPKEPKVAEFEELVLLAILRLKNRAYGMAIRREIEERTERRTALGAVYTTLERLKKKGYVSSWIASPSPKRGGRAKIHYKMTVLGNAALRNAEALRNAMSAGL